MTLPELTAGGFRVRILADSVCDHHPFRATTIEHRFPRFILAEINTHRDRCRSSASSRAIPWDKMRRNIQQDPFLPLVWGAEQKGMQTGGAIDNPTAADEVWLRARDLMLGCAQELADLGVHKSLCNRLTENWMWCTQVMTATSWKNYFRQLCHKDAEVHFRQIATMTQAALAANTPTVLREGDWHLPYILPEERNDPNNSRLDLAKMSTARTARVSYMPIDGTAPNREKDMDLFEKLLKGSSFGHWAPLEAPAECVGKDYQGGPLRGWRSLRKHPDYLPLENADADCAIELPL